MSDQWITALVGLLVVALLLSMRLIRPYGSRQPRHGARWLDAHDVPADKRYGPYDRPAAAALSALETMPDPVSPFAARAF